MARKAKTTVHKTISAKALQEAIADCDAILEENGHRSGEMSDVKRLAAEKGMDVQAFGILLRLFRKGQKNPATLGSILRSFDHGRATLALDDMVPPDFFEGSIEIATDYETETVEKLDDHRTDAA